MRRPDPPLTPDAVASHLSLRLLPAGLRPYGRLMRLERPIGWQLLFWPCVFCSLLASIGHAGPVQWLHMALFLIGAVLMRGAGCTLNDIIDRDVDAKVARTAARPIPSGEVSSAQALLFLCLLLLGGLAVLLTFNLFTILLASSALVLVAIYPFMKRITNWPQIVLGLVFSWGALVGWGAQSASFDGVMLLAYGACVAWIIGYDTIYAFQDLEDDALAGVGSSAQALGTHARPFIGACYALMLMLMAAALWQAGAGPLGYVGLGLTGLQLLWQVKTLDLGDPTGCLARFKSNTLTGGLVSLGLLLDALI